MNKQSRQGRDTENSLEGEIVLTFGQMFEVLTNVYRVQPSEIGRFTARVKKIQREGVPIGANVGKGPKARYSIDQVFQLIIVLELAELSMSLTTASRMVRDYWPDGPVSLAPAQAWLMHISEDPADEDSVLILASASETEGFARYADAKEAMTVQARAFLVSKPTRPMDQLSSVALSSVLSGKRLNLGGWSFSNQRWRSNLIDCSSLVTVVVRALAAANLVTTDDFTSWAKAQCSAFPLERD